MEGQLSWGQTALVLLAAAYYAAAWIAFRRAVQRD